MAFLRPGPLFSLFTFSLGHFNSTCITLREMTPILIPDFSKFETLEPTAYVLYFECHKVNSNSALFKTEPVSFPLILGPFPVVSMLVRGSTIHPVTEAESLSCLPHLPCLIYYQVLLILLCVFLNFPTSFHSLPLSSLSQCQLSLSLIWREKPYYNLIRKNIISRIINSTGIGVARDWVVIEF